MNQPAQHRPGAVLPSGNGAVSHVNVPASGASPIAAQKRPLAQGLYHPANEHDACGVGFVAHIKGQKSHAIVQQGLLILKNLTHRGAVGADPKASDGDRKSTRLNSSH